MWEGMNGLYANTTPFMDFEVCGRPGPKPQVQKVTLLLDQNKQSGFLFLPDD